jgi:diguanylate cyclase (GGDEF)-like protein
MDSKPRAPVAPPGWFAQEGEAQLRRLDRRELWIWISTVTVTLLTATAFFLLAIPQLVQPSGPLFGIDPGQTVKALVGLLLLFNVHAVRKQWMFRRLRRELNQQIAEATPARSVDPRTGLYSRTSVEQLLAREITAARRKAQPLTLLTVAVDDFREMVECHGPAFGDAVAAEFARRLRKATRGSDIAVRMSDEEFLMVLPDCSVRDVGHIRDRLGELEIDWRGRKFLVAYSTAWVDYQPGEMAGELVRRAEKMLQLYRGAGQNAVSAVH